MLQRGQPRFYSLEHAPSALMAAKYFVRGAGDTVQSRRRPRPQLATRRRGPASRTPTLSPAAGIGVICYHRPASQKNLRHVPEHTRYFRLRQGACLSGPASRRSPGAMMGTAGAAGTLGSGFWRMRCHRPRLPQKIWDTLFNPLNPPPTRPPQHTQKNQLRQGACFLGRGCLGWGLRAAGVVKIAAGGGRVGWRETSEGLPRRAVRGRDAGRAPRRPRGALVGVSAFPAAGGDSSFASRLRGSVLVGTEEATAAVTLLETATFWVNGLPSCGGAGGGGGAGGAWAGSRGWGSGGCVAVDSGFPKKSGHVI